MNKIIKVLMLFILILGCIAVVKSTMEGQEINYDQIFIDDYNIYGESLNISVNGSYENTFYLENIDNQNTIEVNTTEEIDDGIDPTLIDEGEYYIKLDNESVLASEQQISEEYYTITRNNANYLISLETDVSGYLVYSKTKSELPENVYDIIIDPGHGGDDAGAIAVDESTTESDINLYVSLLLYDALEEMGYKVALTRNSDINPGNCEGVDKYCEGGRVDLAYETNAKILLSIHHNAGGNSGFEIYDSTFSSHELSEILVENLKEIATPSGKDTSQVSEGVYNELIDGENIDYYYMIREIGGIATAGYNEENAENNQSKIGAQGLILELGYIDNLEDFSTLVNDDYQIEEVQLIAQAIDQYVNN